MMPVADVHVILNPKSGGGRTQRQQTEITTSLTRLGVHAPLHVTRAAGHAEEIAFELANSGARVIAAAGGDGTVHEVGNGILRSGKSAALAVIPLGTGNDFAKVVPGALPLVRSFKTI